MCGILAIFHAPQGINLRRVAVSQISRLRHRGPDWSGCVQLSSKSGKQHAIAHERLMFQPPTMNEQQVSMDK